MPALTSRDVQRAKALQLHASMAEALQDAVDSAVLRTALPSLALAWIKVFGAARGSPCHLPDAAVRRSVASAVTTLHREGEWVWGLVWQRLTAFRDYPRETSRAVDVPWHASILYLQLCRLLIMCLQAQGSRFFFGNEALAILATAFRLPRVCAASERPRTEPQARVYEAHLVAHLHRLWSQVYSWGRLSDWEAFTWHQIAQHARAFGKAVTPAVSAVLNTLPFARVGSYALIRLMKYALYRGWSTFTVMAKPTPLLTFRMWAHVASLASALCDEAFCVTLGTCPPAVLELLASEAYTWDPQVMAAVVQAGQCLRLWTLRVYPRMDISVREYAASTREAWKALSCRPMDAACFRQHTALAKQWSHAKLAQRPCPVAPSAAAATHEDVHPADAYPAGVNPRHLLWTWDVSMPEGLASPAPAAAAAHAGDVHHAGASGAASAASRDACGLHVPRVQALAADHGFTAEDVERMAPIFTDLAQQLWDPVAMDLVQRCPVVLRLTNGETTTKAYERDEIAKWVGSEVQRQHRVDSSKAPVVNDPFGNGVIHLHHPRGWYCQPHHLWVAFRTVVKALQALRPGPPHAPAQAPARVASSPEKRCHTPGCHCKEAAYEAQEAQEAQEACTPMRKRQRISV